MEASSAFAHRSLHEVTDYFEGMAKLKDRSLTRQVQYKTDRNFLVEAVVKNALHRREEFPEPETKAAALRHIRENQKVERQRERAAAAAENAIPVEVMANGVETEPRDLVANIDGDYVPRPANFDELRAQREQNRKKK